MGVAATSLKALPSLFFFSSEVRVLDMHVKFGKQFAHYLILFQELKSMQQKNLSSEKGNQKKNNTLEPSLQSNTRNGLCHQVII